MFRFAIVLIAAASAQAVADGSNRDCFDLLALITEHEERLRDAVLSVAPVAFMDNSPESAPITSAYRDYGRTAVEAFQNYRDTVISECRAPD